jgi:hypothetical protein
VLVLQLLQELLVPPQPNLISKTAQVATIASVVAVDAAFDVTIAGNVNVFDGSKSLTEATIDAAGSACRKKSFI